MAPSRFSIVVVGSLNLDLLLHVPHLPVAGETQSVTRFYRLPGGKGANQAVAAARLGASTAMLGALGRDDAGRLLLDALHDAGVSTECISRQADALDRHRDHPAYTRRRKQHRDRPGRQRIALRGKHSRAPGPARAGGHGAYAA